MLNDFILPKVPKNFQQIVGADISDEMVRSHNLSQAFMTFTGLK